MYKCLFFNCLYLERQAGLEPVAPSLGSIFIDFMLLIISYFRLQQSVVVGLWKFNSISYTVSSPFSQPQRLTLLQCSLSICLIPCNLDCYDTLSLSGRRRHIQSQNLVFYFSLEHEEREYIANKARNKIFVFMIF